MKRKSFKAVTFSIHSRLYPCLLTISTDCAENIIRYIRRLYGEKPDGRIVDTMRDFDESDDVFGRTYDLDRGRTLVRFRDRTPSLGVVAHELVHATYNTLNYVGVNLSDEEAFTYLFEWYLSETLKRLPIKC